MTDRELLEAAAKAAGMQTRWDQPRGSRHGVIRARFPGSGDAFPVWSPLTDDGDALRLAVKLYLWEAVRLAHRDVSNSVDIYAATRRAIVRAAAAMAASEQDVNGKSAI